MGQLDIGQTTISGMTDNVDTFEVDPTSLDDAQNVDRSTWTNENFDTWLGYYKTIPELKKAIDGSAIWTVGRGFQTDIRSQKILERINGWGEDSFQSIMWNMLVMKKINGDSYAEIMRSDKGTLVNIKPLNPSTTKIILNKQGIITGYEETHPKTKQMIQEFKPSEIFHLCNDRLGSEIHGMGVPETCQWVIDARREAMNDWKRLSHRSTIRVLYIDEEDTDQINTVREQYKEAIRLGELLIVPGKNTENQFQELTLPPIQNFLDWIRYLENFFYVAAGIAKIITGGAADFTEAGGKMSYLTFEQPSFAEQKLLEQDILNQLGIELEYNKPVSLKDNVQSDEAANTGQVGVQPNETETGVNRSE